MKNFLKNNRFNQQGYTIVEIIIVIMVIGILVSIVTVGGQGYLDRSAEESVKSSLMDAQREMKKIFNRTGEFPSEVPGTASIASGVDIAISGDGSQFCITGTSRGASFYISDKVPTPVAGNCSSYTPPDPDPDPTPAPAFALNITPSAVANLGVDDDGNFQIFNLVPSGGTPPYSYSFSSANSDTEVISYGSLFPPGEIPWTGGDYFVVQRHNVSENNDAVIISPNFTLPDAGISLGDSEFWVRSMDSGYEPDYVCTTWGPAGFIAKINIQVTDANNQTTQATFDIKC